MKCVELLFYDENRNLVRTNTITLGTDSYLKIRLGACEIAMRLSPTGWCDVLPKLPDD